MADAPVATTAETPAAEAPASAFAEARTILDRTTDTPTSSAPESTESDESDESSPPKQEAAGAEGDGKPSRRERARGLEQEIETRVRAEFQARQEAADAQRVAEQQTRTAADQAAAHQAELTQLIERAEQGDYESSVKLAGLLKSNRATQAAINSGREQILAELGRDLNSAIDSLEGADADGKAALKAAPSVAQALALASEQARKAERTTWESQVGTLKAEIASLKGQLAGRGSSPEAASGYRSRGAASFPTTFRGIAEQEAARLGVPLQ